LTIFANFRRKNWRFLKNQWYGHFWKKTSSSLSKKANIFANFLAKIFSKSLHRSQGSMLWSQFLSIFTNFFRRKYFWNNNIGYGTHMLWSNYGAWFI
jgi:hypothetical protein